MPFAAQARLRNRTYVQTAVQVLTVHHVVKREARVLARCGQNLKESAVARVRRVPIAAAVGITRTDPGLQQLDRWLPPGLSHERARMLRQVAPGTGLQCTPEQKVELSGIGGIEDINAPFAGLAFRRCSPKVIRQSHCLVVFQFLEGRRHAMIPSLDGSTGGAPKLARFVQICAECWALKGGWN